MQLIPKKDHGLTARKGLDHSQMSRKERRAWEYLSAGRRAEEVRAMYNEMFDWATKHNDHAIIHNLRTKFYPYVRMDKQLPMSKTKSEQLRKLYDETRADIRAAHYEDVAI